MTTSSPLRLALALAVLLGACKPRTLEQQAQDAAQAARDAAPFATEPDPDRLSPPDLAQAQAGTLKGYREDAARLSAHYSLDDKADPAERRRWMALAAATGSNVAIRNEVDRLRLGATPSDCAQARALIDKAKAQYARELAAAPGQDRRDQTSQALESLRRQESEMRDGACAAAG